MSWEPGDMATVDGVTMALLEPGPINQQNWNVLVVQSNEPSLPKGFVFKIPTQVLDRESVRAVPFVATAVEWLKNCIIEVGWM